jgi:hypothetical protein
MYRFFRVRHPHHISPRFHPDILFSYNAIKGTEKLPRIGTNYPNQGFGKEAHSQTLTRSFQEILATYGE